MILGLLALVLTTYQRGGMGSVKVGVVLGVGAGLLFGVAFTLTSQTSDAAGLSPVLIQRISGLLFLIVLQRFDKAPILALRVPARRWAIGSGLAGGVALGSLKLGYIKGTAGPVSVAASQFAAVAVVLSVIFNKERMRPWQAVGVAAGGVGVALMALG
jgi:drug/metabolite transporter (DMT)-like permease